MSLLTRRLVQRFYHLRPFSTAADHKNFKVIGRFPLLSNILESDSIFINQLKSQESLTSSDWENGREELRKLHFSNGKSIDALITNLCYALKNKEAIKDYINFLKSNNYDINMSVAGRYVSSFDEKNPTDLEKQTICALHDDMRKKYPIWDAATCESFIFGLCLTDRWEESIELLDMIEITSNITPPALNTIICAAFRNEKIDIGWKYMKIAVEKDLPIYSSVDDTYLEYCLKTFKDEKALEENLLRVFKFCKETDRILSQSILDKYSTVFKNLGYEFTPTPISRVGNCSKCSYQLPASIITKEEFDEMSELFMEKVVVNDNVYYNSNPKEYKKFKQFLESTLPYDIVIDGLNVAHLGQCLDSGTKSRNLSRVIEHFVGEKKTVLLLGRQHMLRWKNFDYIRLNTKMFLLENSSQDDPSLLYATFYGGMKTCFVSRDLMRQHKAQLPKNMRGLFKKWQLSHQYSIDSNAKSLIEPIRFHTGIQNDENGWHIPYYPGKHEIGTDSYELATHWICLRKPSK